VIKIYREERWYELLEEALFLGLDCANRLGDETNSLRFSLELLSDGTSHRPSRSNNQNSIIQIMKQLSKRRHLLRH
jgi:Foie gras liver health family 1